MSEATLTAPAPTPAGDIQEGAIVHFSTDDELPQLSIVADPATGSGTIQVITRCCPDHDDLITRAAARDSITDAPAEPDAAQWALAQRLVQHFAAQARDRTQQAQSSLTQARDEASEAREKIASMRAYAIDKHLDGTICREGLNDFLDTHGLELYSPRHSARVTATFDVEVYDAGNDYSATSMIRDRIEVCSEDEDEVRITSDHGLDISDVELVRDE